MTGPSKRETSALPSRNSERGVAPRPLQRDQGLLKAVGLLELPILLIDLDNLTVRAISELAVKRLGVNPSSVVGHSVLDLLPAEEREAAGAALAVLRDGVIDFIRADRRFSSIGASEESVTHWARTVQFDTERFALSEFAFGSEPRESPLAQHFGREPLVMALGSTDPRWVISSVSSEIEQLLDLKPQSVVGWNLLSSVKAEEAAALVEADRFTGKAFSVARNVHLRDALGQWRPLSCVLTALAHSEDRCFMLIDAPEPSARRPEARVAELEQHLARIAVEVSASGILETMASLPGRSGLEKLSGLTARQQEVLSRLLRGERVATIAKGMYLSESSVRNHLSALFRHFGVHSQAELLASLMNA